jgi:putative ABC transport system permease protein
MSDAALSIPWWRLLFMLPPVLVLLVILFRWTDQGRTLLYAAARMVGQLILIGYVLVWLFQVEQAGWVLAALTLMMAVAGWIMLRPLGHRTPRLYLRALACIATCGGGTLAIVIGGVLRPENWHDPRIVIPLAGMIFAGAMNQTSLSAERYMSERERGADHPAARAIALRAALIPILNSFFAVGLVQLPGMMTGQILAGTDPLIAVRYQILVMFMLLSAGGLSSAMFLTLMNHDKKR